MRNDTRYSQFEDISAASFLGRLTGTGPAITLSSAQATSLLDIFTPSIKGLVPASGGGTSNFLRADGTWSAPPGSGGVSDGNKTDITVSGSGATWLINNSVVNFAKIQNSAAGLSVVGRATNSSGVFAEITAASDGAVLRRSGTSVGFGTLVTASIADSQITYAKIQNISSSRLLGRHSGTSGVTQEISIGSGLSLDSDTGVLSSTILGISDGNKGDVTVASSGTSWTINLNIDKAWSGTHSFENGDFRLYNPANTFYYSFPTSAIVANRTITLPLLTGNDIFTLNDFAATLANKTLGSGTVFSATPTINDGIKFTFNPDGTLSGLNVGSHTADPSTPDDGDLYYNSTDGELRARISGAWIALGASGGTVSGSGTAGQITYWSAGSIIASEAGFEYDSTNNRMIVPTIRGTAGTFTLASNNGTGSVFTLADSGTVGLTATTYTFTTGSSSLSSSSSAMGLYTASATIGDIASNFFIYTGSSNQLTFYRSGTSAISHTINVTSGDASGNNGDHILLNGGQAYTTSGNGNGGNITLTSGQRRTAGSGIDGSIFLNPLTGSVTINNTSTPLSGKLSVKGGGTTSGVTFLTVDSTGTQRFEITDGGNIGIGQGTYGSGVGVISIANASTAPSTNPTNSVILYTKDVASTSELYVKTETGSDICISGLMDVVLENGTTLTLDDKDHRGKFIYFTSGSSITVTVPNSLKEGFNCVLMQDGGGVISVTGSGGTTINGKTSTTGQYDTIGLLHYKATDVYFGR